MGVIQFLLHLLHFVLPAWFMSAVLSFVVVGWKGLPLTGPRARRWVAVWLWLGLAGTAVLVAGLLWLGRDGRMGTYAALVLVMGLLAAWLRQRPAPGRRSGR